MISDDRVDEALRTLGEPLTNVPPLGDLLESQLSDLKRTKTRSPVQQLAVWLAVCIAIGGGMLALLSLRRDLSELPRTWLIMYCAGWTVSFVTLAYLAIMPPSGAVSPRWRAAGIFMLMCAVTFVAIGLLIPRSVPGLSKVYPQTFGALLSHGHYCLRWGITTAIVPVALGTLLLRGAVPVGTRWVGAALGAAGGALGGLMLHLHCAIADPMHVGLIHGGVLILSAALAAAITPRFLRA